MEYPCPVFDEEAEISDQQMSELLSMLVSEAHFSLDELRASWSQIHARKAD